MTMTSGGAVALVPPPQPRALKLPVDEEALLFRMCLYAGVLLLLLDVVVPLLFRRRLRLQLPQGPHDRAWLRHHYRRLVPQAPAPRTERFRRRKRELEAQIQALETWSHARVAGQEREAADDRVATKEDAKKRKPKQNQVKKKTKEKGEMTEPTSVNEDVEVVTAMNVPPRSAPATKHARMASPRRNAHPLVSRAVTSSSVPSPTARTYSDDLVAHWRRHARGLDGAENSRGTAQGRAGASPRRRTGMDARNGPASPIFEEAVHSAAVASPRHHSGGGGDSRLLGEDALPWRLPSYASTTSTATRVHVPMPPRAPPVLSRITQRMQAEQQQQQQPQPQPQPEPHRQPNQKQSDLELSSPTGFARNVRRSAWPPRPSPPPRPLSELFTFRYRRPTPEPQPQQQQQPNPKPSPRATRGSAIAVNSAKPPTQHLTVDTRASSSSSADRPVAPATTKTTTTTAAALPPPSPSVLLKRSHERAFGTTKDRLVSPKPPLYPRGKRGARSLAATAGSIASRPRDPYEPPPPAMPPSRSPSPSPRPPPRPVPTIKTPNIVRRITFEDEDAMESPTPMRGASATPFRRSRKRQRAANDGEGKQEQDFDDEYASEQAHDEQAPWLPLDEEEEEEERQRPRASQRQRVEATTASASGFSFGMGVGVDGAQNGHRRLEGNEEPAPGEESWWGDS